jgi:hypothetical protein
MEGIPLIGPPEEGANPNGVRKGNIILLCTGAIV